MIPDHIREAIENYIPSLEGWCLPERACELCEIVIEERPRVVVELGVFGGRSALAMAFGLRHNNNGGRLYAIDPWRVDYAMEGEWDANKDWYTKNIDINEIHTRAFLALSAHNIDEWLVFIRAASQHVFQLFPKINLLNIDANHSEVASYRDARLYVPNVVRGGIILLDDLDWQVKEGDKSINSTAKAREFIESQCDLVRQSGNMGIYRKK